MRKGKPIPEIDLVKLRAMLRLQSDEQVFYMLDEAIELLTPGARVQLFGQYLPLEQLRPDAQRAPTTLLDDVKAFERASRAGRCLAQFAAPDEYARRVVEIVDALDEGSRGRHLGSAERFATEEQRKALADNTRRSGRARR